MKYTRTLATLGVALAWSLACTGETTEEPADPPAEEPATTIPGSGTQDDPYVLECSTAARDLPTFDGEAFVTCPDGCTSGSVWGTCTYTFDSKVCAAAIHSGALDGAGTTKALHQAGQESYSGSEQNGITSSDWGSYEDTLSFARMAGTCAGDGGGGGGADDGGDRDREVRRPGQGGGGGGRRR